jgi:hypothetical protein
VIGPRLDHKLAISWGECVFYAVTLNCQTAFSDGNVLLLVRVEVKWGLLFPERNELGMVEQERDGEGETPIRQGDGNRGNSTVETLVGVHVLSVELSIGQRNEADLRNDWRALGQLVFWYDYVFLSHSRLYNRSRFPDGVRAAIRTYSSYAQNLGMRGFASNPDLAHL